MAPVAPKLPDYGLKRKAAFTQKAANLVTLLIMIKIAKTCNTVLRPFRQWHNKLSSSIFRGGQCDQTGLFVTIFGASIFSLNKAIQTSLYC